jgi:hypothetical protein
LPVRSAIYRCRFQAKTAMTASGSARAIHAAASQIPSPSSADIKPTATTIAMIAGSAKI